MKTLFTILFLSILAHFGYTQNKENALVKDKHFKIIENPKSMGLGRVELFSDIDSTWNKWKLQGYNFGFDPKYTPMYTTVNGILSTPYMIQVRGNDNELNKKRWGYHVFEGYAKDDKSRITMLVNKHVEVGKPVAEMYYFSAVYNGEGVNGYAHSESAYNWFRLGSDVKYHSYLFSRDKAIFYGSLKLTNALTLGNIGKDNLQKIEPVGDAEHLEENPKYVNYKELKDGGNGTLFYDKDNHIVVIKINGTWMKLSVEPLPKDIKYDFE